MIVYVETNFVLELALRQEECKSCTALVGLASEGHIELGIPAYSLLEPFHTLRGRERARLRLKAELDMELDQLRRSERFEERLLAADRVSKALVEANNEHWQQMLDTRELLQQFAFVLPINGNALDRASWLTKRHDLSEEDAAILASVLIDLESSAGHASCFLNRNWKDFADPQIIDSLTEFGCRLISSFESGLRYVESQVD